MSRYELNHWQFNSSARMSFFRNLGSARKYVSHIQWPFFYILILWLRRLCQLHLTLRPFTTFFFSAFFCSLLFDDKEKWAEGISLDTFSYQLITTFDYFWKEESCSYHIVLEGRETNGKKSLAWLSVVRKIGKEKNLKEF